VLADRSGNISQIVYSAATNADALHAAGEFEKAADLFAEAERRWQELQAECPLLYSVQGYGYCDLLQSLGRPARYATERHRHCSGRELNTFP
jgi:hypothetical protein